MANFQYSKLVQNYCIMMGWKYLQNIGLDSNYNQMFTPHSCGPKFHENLSQNNCFLTSKNVKICQFNIKLMTFLAKNCPIYVIFIQFKNTLKTVLSGQQHFLCFIHTYMHFFNNYFFVLHNYLCYFVEKFLWFQNGSFVLIQIQILKIASSQNLQSTKIQK